MKVSGGRSREQRRSNPVFDGLPECFAMQISPDYESFARAYESGDPQIVSTRLVADLETPVSAMLKLTRNARYSFLLESVEGGAVRGRYSILGMNPDLIWK